MVSLPRLVLAAPASGHGKTTVATGLMAALRAGGLAVSGHKVGPDYIDPSYHALATGRPGRNLDPHLQGEHRVVPLLRHGAQAMAGAGGAAGAGASAGVGSGRAAEVAVVEGVMGLFDGALGTGGYASTAHIARLIGAPVVLVVDASAAGRSVAATVHGFATFDPGVHLAGVILNKLGSERHEAELRQAIEPLGVPVLGALRRSDGIHAPSRHLGLVPATEREAEAATLVDRLREWVAGGADLDGILRVARGAPPLAGPRWDPVEQLGAAPGAGFGAGPGAGAVVAAAAGPAFTFRYTENIELLRAAGVDVVDTDPLADTELPERCDGLYFGGGFPEVHIEGLSANAALRADIAAAVGRGVPVVAECAGLTYLCTELDGAPMTGVLPASAAMTDRRVLGYRSATAVCASLLGPAGTPVSGHEFHRTRVTPARGARPAWRWQAGSGGSGEQAPGGQQSLSGQQGPSGQQDQGGKQAQGEQQGPGGQGPQGGQGAESGTEGFVTDAVHASYLHVHWAGHPHLARAFATAVGQRRHAGAARG